MNYTYNSDDVKLLLDKVRRVVENNSFYYKNDKIAPQVVFKAPILTVLAEIEDNLPYKDIE